MTLHMSFVVHERGKNIRPYLVGANNWQKTGKS